jgi:hypothetical protein
MPHATLVRALGVGIVMVLVAALPTTATAATRRASSATLTAPARVAAGSVLRLSGQIRPAAKRAVVVQRRSGSGWVTAGRGTTTSAGRYSVSLSVPATSTGRFVLRAYSPAAARHRAATSRTRTVTLVARPGLASTPLGSKTAFSYLMGTKFRWNPCRPIAYRVNPNGAPSGWNADVTGALQRVTAASGLQFRYLGASSALPSRSQEYATNGEQLLIGYVKPGQSDLIPANATRGGLAGMGGASGRTVNATSGVQGQLTQGFVALNLDIVKALPAGFGPGSSGWQGTRGQLLMHELGHAMGLGHTTVDAPNKVQMMYPVMGRKYATWGAGDLAGLTNVGARGGCITEAPSPSGRAAPTPHVRGLLD